MVKKALAITGATGRKSGGGFARIISKNLVILNKEFEGGIRLLTRKQSKTDEVEKLIPNAEFYKGSFDDEKFLDGALSNVDTLVHIAGIMFSTKLVNSAVRCKVRRLILVHTTGIYSKYKAASQVYKNIEKSIYQMCKENNILLTILRPTMIYGNVEDANIIKFIKMVDKLPLMPVVNGARYELQPVHYLDLSQAYYDVLMNKQETVNKDFILSGGRPILLRDMLLIIGENLGKKTRFISCPFWIAYLGAWFLYLITFTKKDYREKVQRLCEPRIFDHSEATIAFGYAPRNFENGIVDEIEEYKSRK